MYKPISFETVEAVLDRMDSFTEEQTVYLSQQMQREQPFLQTYLLAVDEEFTQDEQEMILYIGVACWLMMKESNRRLSKVTEERIDKADERNFTFLNNLSEDEKSLETMISKMMEDYPEPTVFGYMVSALIEEDTEEPGIRDELVGLAFLHLKTALDAMIASLKG